MIIPDLSMFSTAPQQQLADDPGVVPPPMPVAPVPPPQPPPQKGPGLFPMLLLVAGGYGVYRYLKSKESSPGEVADSGDE